MTDKTFIEKLAGVQNDLKAPKAKTGKAPYASRNAEQILSQAKPLLFPLGLIVTLDDKIIQIGDKYFVQSIALVTDGKETATGSGVAELVPPSAMTNQAQASGSTSSYARKFALQGVFGIGDSEDADHEKYVPQNYESYPSKPTLSGIATEKQVGMIEAKTNGMKLGNPEKYAEFVAWYKTELENKPFKALTKAEASKVIDQLNG